MFKLVDKKIIAILRCIFFLLNWPYGRLNKVKASVASAAVYHSVVVVYSSLVVASIGCEGLCWVLVVWRGTWCPPKFSNHLAEGERVGFFQLIVLWLSVFCVSYSYCPGLVCSQ